MARKPRKIAVISRKGGAGKTSSAVGLASSLAEIGQRTLLVDCDASNRTATNHLYVDNMPSLANVLTGAASFEDAAESRENLFVVAGSPALERLDEPQVAEAWRRLSTVMTTAEGFDYAIFDCPSGWHLPCELAAREAIQADWGLCILPVASSLESFESARATQRILAGLGGEKRTRLLLTMRTAEWINSDTAAAAMSARDVRWLKAQIPYSRSLQRLVLHSLTPHEDSNAWALRNAYDSMAAEVHRLRIK